MREDCHARNFRVPPADEVDLSKWPTSIDPLCDSGKAYRKLLAEHVLELSKRQELLYAAPRYAVLLVFQGMDGAGKDGAIRHVMSGINPQGCEVSSFKQPTPVELAHDFLWRTTLRLPERGRIGVFNRSHYEEVLVTRVHPEILEREDLPRSVIEKKDFWNQRYRSIVDWEAHLHRNGTRIVKFFLHLSKQEQRKRFLERIDDQHKNWKFSAADVEERKFWKDYVRAYEACLGATSTADAPWYVVPADDKDDSRLIVSRIILELFNDLDLHYPRTSAKRRRQLHTIRKSLTK